MAKAPIRLEHIEEALDQTIEDPGPFLDSLVNGIAKKQDVGELWRKFHEAVGRDQLGSELAFAYEGLIGSRRIKLLSSSQQALIFMHAAEFFGDVFGDTDGAASHLTRVLQIQPDNEDAFHKLEKLLIDARDGAKLADFYTTTASRIRDPVRKLAVLRNAVAIVTGFDRPEEHITGLHEQILKFDPTDGESRDALEQLYLAAGRHKEAVKLLEQSLGTKPPPEADRAAAACLKLVRLYSNDLGEPQRATPHIEQLLALDPGNEEAIGAAEALLDNRAVAMRAASALSDAFDAVGDTTRAAEILSKELELVRGGPRKREVQRRLAIIRMDVIGDRESAYTLFEPVIAGDPTDSDARDRYVVLARELGRVPDAAKVLARVLHASKDPGVTARINAQVGALFLEAGDKRRAQAALEQALDAGADAKASLEAARALAELHREGKADKRAAALEALARHEPEPADRHRAAEELIGLCGELGQSERAIPAWRALVDSERGDEALEQLEALYQASSSEDGLIEVLELRAQRSGDEEQARELAFRAADLRSSRASDATEAMSHWRALLERYGPWREVHARMEPLLVDLHLFEELGRVLESEAELAPEPDRASVLARLGRVRVEQLGNAAGAVEAFQHALSIDPRESTSRATLQEMLATPETVLAAADVLDPVYRQEGDNSALLGVLEARAEASESAVRLTSLEEAVEIATGPLSDHDRALELAARGLFECVENDKERVPEWIGRVNGAGNRERRAALLTEALGSQAIDSPEILSLARAAGDALAEVDQVDSALGILRRALEYDPSSADLLERVDDLLASKGSPEERLTLYRQALEQPCAPERRKKLMHSIAEVQKSQLEDLESAKGTLGQIIEEDAADPRAHTSLVEVLVALGDLDSMYAELQRAVEHLEGEARLGTIQRMAEVSAERNDVPMALANYRELLAATDPPDEVLDAIRELAAAAGEFEILRDVLNARIRQAPSVVERAMGLERLAQLQSERLEDGPGAVAAWKAAAELLDPNEDQARIRRIFERILAVAPEDTDAAAKLIEIYADAAEWELLPNAFRAFLATSTGERALEMLDDLGGRAANAGAIDAFTALTNAVGERFEKDDPPTAISARTFEARLLASLPDRRDDAAAAYRHLVEISGASDASVVNTFEALLESSEMSKARREDWRWLYDWRSKNTEDAVAVLLEWAETEEHKLDDKKAALELLEMAFDRSEARTDILANVARLQGELGDAEGALATLKDLEAKSEGENLEQVQSAVARILLTLGRADEALDRIAPIFEASPANPDALKMLQAALTHDDARTRAAEMLERAVVAADDASQSADILENLVTASAGTNELAEQRLGWYERLLEHRSSEPEKALELAVRGAREHPAHEPLWEKAESLAQELEKPEPVGEAQRAALGLDLDPEVAEQIGQRAVDFHEEWFDDSNTVTGLLERVLELAPRAEWALDRLKLAFNAAGRWDDLFRVYDRAVERATDDDSRVALLDEAALAAKDFASNAGKAIEYFEKRREIKPDSRTDSALERLYEREGRTLPLIELLSTQLGRLEDEKRQLMRARIASLWLDVGDDEHAFELASEILDEEAERDDAIALLERIVKRTVPPESLPPAGTGRRRKKVLRTRDKAAAILKDYYAKDDRTADVVRMLEVELEAASTVKERAKRLRDIVELRTTELEDYAGAFENVAALLALEPSVAGHKTRLAELAEKIDAQDRRATLLVAVAGRSEEAEIQIGLLADAAEVYATLLDDPERAIELHLRVLELAKDGDAALAAARALDPLLYASAQSEQRCVVLEQLASLEREPEERKKVLAEVARVARVELLDVDRSIAAWRLRLDDDASDVEALDGLVDVLREGERYAELIPVLEARAEYGRSPEDSRNDLVAVGQLHANRLDDNSSAIDAWRRVRSEHGADQESFDALTGLLEIEKRWEELASLIEETATAAEGDDRSRLFTWLGDVHREKTNDANAALTAYGRATQWERAVALARETDTEPILKGLADLAGKSWSETQDHAESTVAEAATFAIERLVERWLAEESFERAVELLIESAALPFEQPKRRDLQRQAAVTCADKLADTERAIELFRALFAEDPGDEVAASSVSKLALLLEEAGRPEEVASLWEEQARTQSAESNDAAATALWARAAELAETALTDVERAISDHRQGAALGGEPSLDALARLHGDRDEQRARADALEWLCAQTGDDKIAERSLALADAYVKLGLAAFARARLESAASRATDPTALRVRLSELYRKAELWAPLANLLDVRASAEPDPAEKRKLLDEAADVQRVKLGNPLAAAEFLRQAVELEPDDADLVFTLADALTDAHAFDDAAGVLKTQIERFGSRRPKNRALVHYRLARVLTAAGRRDEALSELQVASKIDQAHPGILRALARTALEEGDLPRAERTYRALLLVQRHPDPTDPDAPSRAEAFIDLSEIAARQDDTHRATEFVESAFEAALESDYESERLEAALRQRGRNDLLARALEARLEGAPPEQAARALADLAMLHAEHLAEDGSSPEHFKKTAERIQKKLESAENVADPAWLALGRVYDWLGDAEAEAKVLEKCLSADSRDVEPLYRLAELRLRDASTIDAGVAAIVQALDVDEDPSRAHALLQRATEVDPDNAEATTLLERLARSAGNQRGLLEALLLVTRRADVSPDKIRETHELALSLGEPASSIAVLRRALVRDPESIDNEYASWLRLALSDLLSDDEVEEAIELKTVAASFLEPHRARAILLDVAKLAEAGGDLERAAQSLEQLREREPADREIWEPLLAIYRRLDLTDKIGKLIDDTVDLVDELEGRTKLRLEQATVMLQDPDRLDDASATLRTLLDEDPSHLGATGLLSGILERQKRFDELAELLTGQLDAAKDREDTESIIAISMRLGALLEQQKRPNDALDIYNSMLDWAPPTREALRVVVRLSESQGDPYALADAMERLLDVESAEEAGPLADKLIELRKEQGDEEGVERALVLVVQRQPSRTELRDELVVRLTERGELDKVGQILKAAFEHEPTNAEIRQRMLDAFQSSGQHHEIVSALERAVEAEPENATLLHARSRAQRELGHLDQALADLEAATNINAEYTPELAAVLEAAIEKADAAEERATLTLRLALLHENSGGIDGARQLLGHVIDADPANVDALGRLTDLEIRAEDFEAAAMACARRLEFLDDRGAAAAALQLAEACDHIALPMTALGVLEAASQRAPDNIELRNRVMTAYHAAGEHKKLAELLLNEAETTPDPDERFERLLHGGGYLIAAGEAERAVGVLEQARALNGEANEGAILLARAYAAMGRPDEGLQILSAVADAQMGTKTQGLADLYREMASILRNEGNGQDALATLLRAYDITPKHGELAMELAELALELGDEPVALRTLRAVTMMKIAAPESSEGTTPEDKANAYAQLGQIAQNSGEEKKARMFIKKALHEDPNNELANALAAQLR